MLELEYCVFARIIREVNVGNKIVSFSILRDLTTFTSR